MLKHKKYEVYTLCLFPPDFRKAFVSDNPKYCYLSTELLLQDHDIPENKKENVPHTTPPLFSFKNTVDKIAFANSISNATDWSGFKETLETILNI